MHLPRLNLRAKLLVILVLSLLLGLGAVSTVLYFYFQSYLNERVSNVLKVYLELAVHSLDPHKIRQPDTLYLKEFVNRTSQSTGCRATIIDITGKVLADSEVPVSELEGVENHLNRPEIRQALEESFGFDIRRSATIKRNQLYVGQVIRLEQDNVGFLRLSLFAQATDRMLVTAVEYFLIAGFFILLISSLLTVLLSRNITANLGSIIRNARKIAGGDLEVQINTDTGDELSDLGKSLNEMSARLSGTLQRLAQERQDLNTVMSSVHEGIIAVRPNGNIIYFNQRALRLLDHASADILERHYQEIIKNKHLSSLVGNFLQKPFFISDEIEIKKDHVLEVVLSPFSIKGLVRKGVVVVLRDISHYKKLEKIRRDFVANVSHEFKTPLAAIRGYSETLLDWGLEDQNISRKYIGKIIKQSNQLENLVSDLLQLARIERLQNLELKPFHPDPIILDIAQQYGELARSNGLHFEVKLAEGETPILGEIEMFRSIIANLLDNAIKYTPGDGQVTVSSTLNGSYWIISVMDSGIGIPEKEQDRIFERFYRVDKARSRAIGGTGLGLSIVKHLAELQQAEISLQSQVNQGSCFSVKFKLANQG